MQLMQYELSRPLCESLIPFDMINTKDGKRREREKQGNGEGEGGREKEEEEKREKITHTLRPLFEDEQQRLYT